MSNKSKTCTKCREEKNIENFNEVNGRKLPVCTPCYNKKARDWYSANKEKARSNAYKRAEFKKLLINEWSSRKDIELIKDFGYKCSLSDKKSIDHDVGVDHFIALSTGHGGTFKGNLIPLERSINISKKDKNPFEWIKNRSVVEQNNFKSVVAYLSEENSMTPKEFEAFVYWCYKNKRDFSQIRKDNEVYGYKRSSLDIWGGLKGEVI